MRKKPDYDKIQRLELEIFGVVKTELPLQQSVEGDNKGLAWWLRREDTYEMESTEYRWQYGYAASPIPTKSIEKVHTRWHLIRSYGLRVSITLIGVLLMFVVIYIALLMEKGL